MVWIEFEGDIVHDTKIGQVSEVKPETECINRKHYTQEEYYNTPIKDRERKFKEKYEPTGRYFFETDMGFYYYDTENEAEKKRTKLVKLLMGK